MDAGVGLIVEGVRSVVIDLLGQHFTTRGRKMHSTFLQPWLNPRVYGRFLYYLRAIHDFDRRLAQ